MEINQVMMLKEKLGFSGIIKASLKLIPTNPSFIILTFLTSLPLFFFLFFLELFLQNTFIQIITIPHDDPHYFFRSWPIGRVNDVINNIFPDFSFLFLLSGLLFLGSGHLLDLINTITSVYCASMIYAGNDKESIKEMLWRPFRKVGLRGPLVTSIYSLTLTALTMIGFISLSTQVLLNPLFGLALIGLLAKYMEWSAIWNMGMVISVLEEKHGYVAIGVSAYISRGSRKRGFLLMIVFFIWKVGLRLIGLYVAWVKKRTLVMITIGQVGLVCLGNVVKWVVFTIYFYDCKKRFLEKKVDVEQGRAAVMVKL